MIWISKFCFLKFAITRRSEWIMFLWRKRVITRTWLHMQRRWGGFPAALGSADTCCWHTRHWLILQRSLLDPRVTHKPSPRWYPFLQHHYQVIEEVRVHRDGNQHSWLWGACLVDRLSPPQPGPRVDWPPLSGIPVHAASCCQLKAGIVSFGHQLKWTVTSRDGSSGRLRRVHLSGLRSLVRLPQRWHLCVIVDASSQTCSESSKNGLILVGLINGHRLSFFYLISNRYKWPPVNRYPQLYRSNDANKFVRHHGISNEL